MVGSFIVLSAPAASAKKVTFPQVPCDSPFGTQNVDITVDIEGPATVDAGEKFTVTFPGGTATLPDSALDGAVNILGFRNLSTSYKSINAFYVPGSLQTSGGATINGNPTPQTGTLSPATKPNTAKFVVAGTSEIPPGTLVTPDWTAEVQAPDNNATIAFFADVLTTTADIENIGLVPVTCHIPPTILLQVKVGAGGGTVTIPTTTSTSTVPATASTAAPAAVTSTTAAGTLPRTGGSSGPLAVLGASAAALGLVFVGAARRRRRK